MKQPISLHCLIRLASRLYRTDLGCILALNLSTVHRYIHVFYPSSLSIIQNATCPTPLARKEIIYASLDSFTYRVCSLRDSISAVVPAAYEKLSSEL